MEIDQNRLQIVRQRDEEALNLFLQAVARDSHEPDSLLGVKRYLNTTLGKYHLLFEDFVSHGYVFLETLYNRVVYQVVFVPVSDLPLRFAILKTPYGEEEEVAAEALSIGDVINYFIKNCSEIDLNMERRRCLLADKLKIREAVNVEVMSYTMPAEGYDLFTFRYRDEVFKLFYRYGHRDWSLMRHSVISDRFFPELDDAIEYIQAHFDN